MWQSVSTLLLWGNFNLIAAIILEELARQRNCSRQLIGQCWMLLYPKRLRCASSGLQKSGLSFVEHNRWWHTETTHEMGSTQTVGGRSPHHILTCVQTQTEYVSCVTWPISWAAGLKRTIPTQSCWHGCQITYTPRRVPFQQIP